MHIFLQKIAFPHIAYFNIVFLQINMKLLIAFALFAAASASIIPPAVIASTNPEVQEILAAIQSPSTDPATAAILQQMLLDVLGVAQPEPQPIAVGPAIIDDYSPISIGPAIVDFPLPDGGAVTAPVAPAPVIPAPVDSSASAPLVQIILNIKSSSDVAVESAPAPTPVHVVDEAVVAPLPVIVVEQPIVPTPVSVVEQPIVAEPVIVVDQPIVPQPVVVVDQPAAPEPVIVAQPIIAAPAIVLPDILN